MQIEVLSGPEEAAKRAAHILAAEARAVIAARGRCVAAFSGGPGPLPMFRALAGEDVPWDKVHIVQVDERVAPLGNHDRNLTHLTESLIERARLPADNVHPMPVEDADLDAAAARYAAILDRLAGSPPVLDLVHLGIGADGHTASLIPGDPVLSIANADVAVTGFYQERRRMTMTYPILNRARRILWYVTGAEKADVLPHLMKADTAYPAGRVRQDAALVVADQAAARELQR